MDLECLVNVAVSFATGAVFVKQQFVKHITVATSVSALYSFLLFWKTASLVSDRINQHNFTCLGEKQRKLASQRENRFESLQSVFCWT